MGIFSSIKKKIRKHRETMRSVTSNEVIALALESGGRLTVGALSARTVLNVNQARQKLIHLNTQGIFKTKYDYIDNSTLYILKRPELYQNLSLSTPSPPTNSSSSTDKRPKLTDASVIQVALRSKGRITPGVLCLRADISIDEAKKKLQELQHKGVFDIEATANGALVYVLNELETFEELMQDELAEEDIS